MRLQLVVLLNGRTLTGQSHGNDDGLWSHQNCLASESHFWLLTGNLRRGIELTSLLVWGDNFWTFFLGNLLLRSMFRLLMLSKLEAVLSNALDRSSFSTVALITFLSTKEFLEQLPVYFYRLSTPLRILANALRLFAGKICLALSAALFRVVAESIEPVT